MLTARDAVADRVAGLEAGADDYLVKPFAIEELVARLRALTRRGRGSRHACSPTPTWRSTCAARSATRAGRTIVLTGRETALLELLLRDPGQTVTRERAIDEIWGGAAEANVVDRYVTRLRRKLGDAAADPHAPRLRASSCAPRPRPAGHRAEQLVHPVLGHRPAEQIALGAVAAEIAQLGELGVGLDPLGDHAQPERVAELHHRRHQRRLARVACPARRRSSGGSSACRPADRAASASEECPVPKSSIASLTPSWRNAPSIRASVGVVLHACPRSPPGTARWGRRRWR